MRDIRTGTIPTILAALLLLLLPPPGGAQEPVDSAQAEVEAAMAALASAQAALDRAWELLDELAADTAPSPPPPPAASFTVACEVLTCTLDARASEGAIVGWDWDLGKFPNRYVSGTPLVEATYPHEGERAVRLIVMDSLERADTTSQRFNVPGKGEPEPPPDTTPGPPPPPPPPDSTSPVPPPPGDASILFDTRAGAVKNSRGKGGDLQSVTSQAAADAMFDYIPLADDNRWTLSTDFDGRGTTALAALYPGGPTDLDVNRAFAVYLPEPLPRQLCVQMKEWAGRHPADRNPEVIGEVGYFDITSDIDLDNSAGRKMFRVLRDIPDRGALWGFDLLFHGPSPGATPGLGYFTEVSGGINPDGSGGAQYLLGFQPEDFYNQPVTITYCMGASSADDAFDGWLRFWWAGEQYLDRTDVPMGSMAFHRFQAPMIIRSPEKDMTDYWWDIVAWIPRTR